jgi:YD repeat-containing protein
VDIRFTKLTDASGYFTPYLELYNSAGVRLAYASSEALVKKVNATATYYLFVTDYSYDATGTYELTMQRDNNPANSRALNYGAITAGSLINPTGINVYRFTATANGKITICSVVQSETSGNFSPYLELYDTTGTRLKYGSGSLQHTFANSGTFYLFITDYSRNGTGIYKFILSSGTVSCSSIDLENPKVKLTWPKDAEIVENGSTYNITWTSSDNVGITSQEILLSTDSGATYPTVIASSLAGSVQSYAWQIPSDLATSHARIKIIAGDAQGNTGEGTNSNDFIISNTALPVSAESTAYEYDKLQRLKKSNSSAGTSAEYTYDASGNRLKAICK